MLDKFITTERATILTRASARIASRIGGPQVDRTSGLPAFLDQLGEALRRARLTRVVDHAQIERSAADYGTALHRAGLTVAQVVHEYGDICQAITELAVELTAPILPGEFQTLNLCLDDAIAGAVSEYARVQETAIKDNGTERLGVFAHELRNQLNAAMLSFDAIKSGRVAVDGSTALVLNRSLLGLRDLIDRSLADVRIDAGNRLSERMTAASFVEEVEISARLAAQARGLQLNVDRVDPALSIEGDRQILAAALSNLLNNAFKFTRKKGNVRLTTRSTADRVLFDVEDECGGLPPGPAEELFRPFEQKAKDRSGVGLGLSICRKAAHANHGEVRVLDLPGRGCVFTLDLPRATECNGVALH